MTGETSMLLDGELDRVAGGTDPNYKLCANGTTAGGPPGLYPVGANCAVTVGDLIAAFKEGIRIGSGGKPS